MANLPSVTCLCPTRNRREFLVESIKMFQAQDYAGEAELLLLNDSDGEDISDLASETGRIVRVIQVPRMSLGFKRNEGARLTTSEVIAHWDDDDIYAPGRLSNQVEFLLASRVSVVGYFSFKGRRLSSGAEWKYFINTDYACGASLVYRRSWVLEHPFSGSVDIGEDNLMIYEARNKGQFATSDGEDFLTIGIHPGNTATKNMEVPQWTRVK